MRIYSTILVLLLSAIPAMAHDGNSRQSAPKIPTVRFCDLIRNPNLYDGKDVRLRAIYVAAFEAQAFGSRKCRIDEEHDVWVEFDLASVRAATKPKVWRKVEEQISCCMFAGAPLEYMLATEMVVTGVFHSSNGHYGHVGQYRFMFTVKSIEELGATKKTRFPEFEPR